MEGGGWRDITVYTPDSQSSTGGQRKEGSGEGCRWSWPDKEVVMECLTDIFTTNRQVLTAPKSTVNRKL